MTAEARHTWYAGLFLALAAGFAIWLGSGDPRPSIAIAIIGALLATGLYALGFVNTSQRHPPSAFYMIGGIFIVMTVGHLRCGGRRSGPGPWIELEDRFVTSAAAPAGVERRPRLYLIRFGAGGFMYRRFTERRIFTSFDSAGVYLAASWPQSLVYGALRIPLRELASCDPDSGWMAPGHTLVRVRHPPVAIAVPDDDERVLAWCQRHEIPEQPSGG